MKFLLVESKEDRDKLVKHVGGELANKFLKLKHNIHDAKYKDLYFWLKKSPQELSDFLYKFEKKEGLIYQDDKWTIYKITSPEMLNNLIGRHKIWCVQTKEGGLGWDFHAGKLGTKYYLYIDRINNKKYLRGINQDDFMEDGLWDENNASVKDKQFINSLPKVS